MIVEHPDYLRHLRFDPRESLGGLSFELQVAPFEFQVARSVSATRSSRAAWLWMSSAMASSSRSRPFGDEPFLAKAVTRASINRGDRI